MKMSRWWMGLCFTAMFVLTGGAACAQGNSQGHGHGHGHGDDHGKGHWKHYEQDDQGGWYADHDRNARVDYWYHEHEEDDDLPPGLAKRDRLPPGLERQLVLRGHLPPGLEKRMHRCPEDLERELPPPPPECEHVIIGGHIVLWNRHTNIVVDIIHFERD